MIRFVSALVAVAVVATGCSSVINGTPHAAAGTSSGFPSQSGSSTAVTPSGFGGPSSTSATSTAWVPYSDPVTKVRFQLPGTVSVVVAADQTPDGTPLTRRSYRYIALSGMLVSVSTTSPKDPNDRIIWDLDKYVADLPAKVESSGFTDVSVAERKSITLDGHPGVQFRVLATSASSGDTSAWLVRAVADHSLLAIMQVVYVAPDPSTELANVRALHARLVASVQLP